MVAATRVRFPDWTANFLFASFYTLHVFPVSWAILRSNSELLGTIPCQETYFFLAVRGLSLLDGMSAHLPHVCGEPILHITKAILGQGAQICPLAISGNGGQPASAWKPKIDMGESVQF